MFTLLDVDLSIFYTIQDVLMPLCIFVILPLAIMWLVTNQRKYKVKQQTEVLMKALEQGRDIPNDAFHAEQRKTLKQRLLVKLQGGFIASFIGIFSFALALFFLLGGDGLEDVGYVVLVLGGIAVAIGLGLLISYWCGVRFLAHEIESEEAQLQNRN